MVATGHCICLIYVMTRGIIVVRVVRWTTLEFEGWELKLRNDVGSDISKATESGKTLKK